MTDPHDLVTIEEAAIELGLEPKRLRGLILRNSLHDPIGDLHYIYRWCIDRLKARQRIPEQEVAP